MKLKTAELEGAALDWAVAKCEGKWSVQNDPSFVCYHPSTDWSQGGPIIEREKLTTGTVVNDPSIWSAESFNNSGMDVAWIRTGPTPLTAAMRCYVASKLGDEIEVPEELG